MAGVYSASFASFPSLTGTEGVTVPAGYVWVLRDMAVWCDSGNIDSEIALEGSEGQAVWVATYSSPNGQRNQLFQGRVVLQAGQSFTLQVFSGTWDVTVCGYQLTAP